MANNFPSRHGIYCCALCLHAYPLAWFAKATDILYRHGRNAAPVFVYSSITFCGNLIRGYMNLYPRPKVQAHLSVLAM